MTDDPKHLWHTLSFWLVISGLAASRTRYRKSAAGALLLCGLGYLGVLHERYAKADLRAYRNFQYRDVDVAQLSAHLAAAIYGWRLLK